MRSILHDILGTYSKMNNYFVSTRLRVLGLALFAFIISAVILSYFSWHHISNPATYYDRQTDSWKTYGYDVDGWGHLIPKMVESGKSWELLPQAVHPRRTFLVPFLFGLSYCLVGIPESVQLLNIVAQAASSLILVYLFALYYKKPLLGLLIGVIWAMWPPFSSYYGYYYSEAVYGLVFVLLWLCITMFLKDQKQSTALLIGMLLALSLHVKITSILVVLGFFLCCMTIWRRRVVNFLPVILLSFAICYLPWPIYNSIKSQRFAPIDQAHSGGAGLWGTFFLMTYPPADGLRTFERYAVPEYREIKEKVAEMDAAAKKIFYRSMIIEQITNNPRGVLGLLLKRFMRFWYHIPGHTFMPTPKTLVVMTPLLLLAFIGAVRRRHRDFNVQVAILLVGGMWILHGVIHAEFRYQFPVFPMLLFLAFVGIGVVIHVVEEEDGNPPS